MKENERERENAIKIEKGGKKKRQRDNKRERVATASGSVHRTRSRGLFQPTSCFLEMNRMNRWSAVGRVAMSDPVGMACTQCVHSIATAPRQNNPCTTQHA